MLAPKEKRIFLENRPRLMTILSDAISSAEDDEDITILLPTAQRPIRDESDSEFADWKQTANVQYRAAVALTRTRTTLNNTFDITIYLPEQSQREMVFTGPLPSKSFLISHHHIHDVKPITALVSDLSLQSSRNGSSRILTTVPPKALLSSLGTTVAEELGKSGLQVRQSEDVAQAFIESRFVKSESELEVLTFASRLARWVHDTVKETLIDSARVISEIAIEAEFTRLSAVCGGSLQAYPPIVGAGWHSSVLHYRTGENETAGYIPIANPSLILIDASPEHAGYTSDLTRTYFRGRPTRQMLEVHGMVSRVQESVMRDHYFEGGSWAALNAAAMRELTGELLENGFFVNATLDELVERGMWGVFMPHGLGHPIGLEVHDPTPVKHVMMGKGTGMGLLADGVEMLPGQWEEDSNEGMSAVADYEIFRGHITTVEPGVYFIPELLQFVREDRDGSGRRDFVNWDKIDHGGYVDMGGVRIEDVIMIDHDGIKRIITRM
ncbi:hypothetical protein HK101_011956 [Irineochytrium annulatum]|nr:hypothetical protein HK101_011956 [Irineochytrium annulatum]